MDGSIWKIPFHWSCYNHPFLPADMAGQNDSWCETNIINNNEHINNKRKPTKEGLDLADA